MSSQNASSFPELDLSGLVSSVVNKTLEDVTVSLTAWQKRQLETVHSEQGVRCLLRMWFIEKPKRVDDIFCNATWDDHYCWPYTPAGTTTSLGCSEAFRKSQPTFASHMTGIAHRVCLSNGTWLQGNWTNYTECADSYDDYVARTEEENLLKVQVRWIVFVGSILSLVCLLSAVSIFCCFRSLWCDRVTVHMHLMAALSFRYVMLYIITEAFIFNRNPNYRSEDWICKTVLSIYLYFTVCSVNWMFIQGIYLNSKLTTNVFDKEAPFKLYIIFGWLFPVPLQAIYAAVMEKYHPVKCWKGYSDMDEIWIILGPIIGALVANLFLLLNILRILLTKVRRNGQSSDSKHFQRAAKATLILSPILGINNLLFIYNPGGIYHKYYVILNSTFGSTQGVFVALVYCYLSSDVCNAIRRCYLRFLARRSTYRNRMMQQQRNRNNNSTSTSSGLIIEQPVHRNRVFSRSNPNLYSTTIELSPASVHSTTTLIRSSITKNKNLFAALQTQRPLRQESSFSWRKSHKNLPNSNEVLVCSRNPFLSQRNTFIRYGSRSSRRLRESQDRGGCNQVIIPLSELV